MAIQSRPAVRVYACLLASLVLASIGIAVVNPEESEAMNARLNLTPSPYAPLIFDNAELNDAVNHGATHGLVGPEWEAYDIYSFDGINDYFEIPYAPRAYGEEEEPGFAVGLWVKPDTKVKNSPLVFRPAGKHSGYALYAGGSGAGVPSGSIFEEPEAQATASSALSTGKWHYVALTYDGEFLSLYVDKELVAEEEVVPGEICEEGEEPEEPEEECHEGPGFTEGTEPIFIGKDDSGHFFDGDIGRVSIVDYATTIGSLDDSALAPIEASYPDPVLQLGLDVDTESAVVAQTGDEVGINEGAEWSTSGKYFDAAAFDGEGYLEVEGTSFDDSPEDFGAEAWVKPEGEQENAAVISRAAGLEEEEVGFALLAAGSTPNVPEAQVYFEDEAELETVSFEASEPLPEGEWSHLALSLSDHTLRLYVNGTLEGMEQVPTTESEEGLMSFFVGNSEDEEHGFTGLIDEVQVWKTGLGLAKVGYDMEHALQTVPVMDPEDPVEMRGDNGEGEDYPLHAHHGEWSGGGDISFTYQWRRCNAEGKSCANIEGATGEEYVPGEADLPGEEEEWKTLRLKVTATNEAGSTIKESGAGSIIEESIARWFNAPVIEGEPIQGETLSVNVEALRGSPEIDSEYEWFRCDVICEPISEATGSTYTLTASDTASWIQVLVTGENAFEVPQAEESDPFGPIQPSETTGKPRLVVRPDTAGEMRVGGNLVATEGEWVGDDTISYGYQWQRCELEPLSCENISGATEATYEPVTEDEELALRVVVVAENEHGESSSVSPVTEGIHASSNTVFGFAAPVALPEVMELLEEAEVHLVSIDTAFGESEAGISFMTDDETLTEAGATIAEAYDAEASEISVLLVTLRGVVPAEDLGAPGEAADRFEAFSVPPLEAQEQEPFAFRSPITETTPLGGYARHAIESAVVWGRNDTHPGQAPWGPHATSVLEAPRAVYSFFTWQGRPGALLRAFYLDGREWSFEFDIKLVNLGNDPGVDTEVEGIPIKGACDLHRSQKDNFWVYARDNTELVSNIGSAGVYWDTAASDSCQVKDLSYGVYRPELLKHNSRYWTAAYINDHQGIFFTHESAEGEKPRSKFTWNFEFLVRGVHCDYVNPWCVNVPPEEAETKEILNLDRNVNRGGYQGPAYLPECYSFLDRYYADRHGRARAPVPNGEWIKKGVRFCPPSPPD